MEALPLSVSSCIRFGWETFKKRLGFFIGCWAIIFAVSVLSNSISSSLNHQGTMASLLGFVLTVFVSILVNLGQTRLSLRAAQSPLTASRKDLWAPELFLTFGILFIVLGLITLLGFICLIIPGIILSVVFMFSNFAIVDNGSGAIEAMKESARITKGNRWRLFLLVLVLLGINILGVMALVVGLLVTTPISMLALAHAYETLKGRTSVAVVPESVVIA